MLSLIAVALWSQSPAVPVFNGKEIPTPWKTRCVANLTVERLRMVTFCTRSTSERIYEED